MLQQTKRLCQKYNIRPSRRKGQNFLIDKKVLGKIIQAANLSRSDLVLEIGPGLGVLTKELAKRVKKVVAVELDGRLIRALREEMKNYRNVEIIEGDVLKFQISNSKFQTNSKFQIPNTKFQFLKLQVAGYKLIANLPYQITSPVLHKFLTQEPKPSEMILMVQKEVAERIVAKPSQSRFLRKSAGQVTFLSVLVQFYAKPEIITYVSKKSFWPEPKVDSALIRITQINTDKNTEKHKIDERGFFQLIKIGFSNRRKQLKNNLAKGLGIEKEEVEKILKDAGLDIKVRAQDLKIEDWEEIVRSLKFKVKS